MSKGLRKVLGVVLGLLTYFVIELAFGIPLVGLIPAAIVWYGVGGFRPWWAK